MKRLRDVIHLRVSREEQAGPEHFSLEFQEDVCRKYSQDTGGEVVQAFTEVQRSWIDEIEKRPAFQKALDYAVDPSNDVDRFIVYRGDRFARKKYVFHMADYILRAAGVELKSATEFFSSTPDGEVNKGISALLAEAESGRLSDRLQRAFAKKRERGGWSGREPYGYRREGGGLVIDEDRMAGWQLARRLVMEGTESFWEIARLLRAAGYKNSSGGLLGARAVAFMLRNPVYAGYLRAEVDGVPVLLPGKHPRVVDPGEWEQLQAAVARIPSKSRGHGRAKRHSPLFGILYCARCGGKLISVNCGGPRYTASAYRAYGCSTRKYVGECDFISVRQDVAEEAVAGLLERLALPPDWRERIAERARRQAPPSVTIEQIEEEERRLTELYQAGYIPDFAEFRRRWDALQEKRLLVRPPDLPTVLELGTIIERGMAALWRHPDATPDSRRKLALAVFDRVVIASRGSRDIDVVRVDWQREVEPLLDIGTILAP